MSPSCHLLWERRWDKPGFRQRVRAGPGGRVPVAAEGWGWGVPSGDPWRALERAPRRVPAKATGKPHLHPRPQTQPLASAGPRQLSPEQVSLSSVLRPWSHGSKGQGPHDTNLSPTFPVAGGGGPKTTSLFSRSARKHFVLRPPEGDSRPHMGCSCRPRNPPGTRGAVEDDFVKAGWWGLPPIPGALEHLQSVFQSQGAA